MSNSSNAWSKLAQFLLTDPEINDLQNRYHNLTGKYLPGWHWECFGDLNNYISSLREMVSEAEAAAKSKKENKLSE